MPDTILIQKQTRHAVVTLNQPQKRNPLPYLKSQDLWQALEQLAGDEDVRAVVLTGAGKAFCSGLDLETLKNLETAGKAHNRDDSRAIRDFFEYLRDYPKPLVAAVNGPAVAGGAGLALACDIVVGCARSRFAFSEVRIGFVPAVVGVYLARTLGERIARDLLLSGRWVEAEEAKYLHLLNDLVDDDRLTERATERAVELAQNSPEAMARTRKLLADTGDVPLHDALERAVQVNAAARHTPDCKEGIRAFLEKRKPRWAE